MGSSPGCAQIYNGKKEKDILSQYISFRKQVQRFFQKYGRTGKAAEKLFRYCIDQQTEQPKREETKNTENKVPVGSVLVEEKTGGVYKVLRVSGGTGEVQYMKPTGTSSTAVVPDTVTINGVLYRVTEISDNAFKGNINLRKVVIGRYVKRIGKKAFFGAKKLKTITIKTKKLTMKTVGSKAFKGIYAKAKIKVPKAKKKLYRNVLRKRGVSGRAVIK